MAQVNIHEAKTRLSQLIKDLEDGVETEVVLARNGKPVARLIGLGTPKVPKKKVKRVGIAEGKFNFDYEGFQALDAEIAREFYEKPLFASPAEMDAWYEARRARKKTA